MNPGTRFGASLRLACLLAALCSCQSLAPFPQTISSELVEMARVDQEVRQKLIDHFSEETSRELERVDARDTERLKEIVARHGWPTRSGVGAEASDAAWLLLQHSPDWEFQMRGLELMQRALEHNDVRGDHVALLTDRVLVHQGKPQIYGTQFQLDDDKFVAFPIADREHLDQRRASVGLQPIAEYAKQLGEVYKKSVVTP